MGKLRICRINEGKRVSVSILTVLFVSGFAMCYPAEAPLRFVDQKLENQICEVLRTEPPFTKSKILRLKSFKNYGGEITNLCGIEVATNLKELVISGNKIKDISPISRLTNLEILGLWDNRIENIEALRGLRNLSELILNDNQIADISPISDIAGLKRLALQRNPLNNDAYEMHIPKIRKNNPGIIIYHDKTLTPERALYIAQRCVPVLVLIAIIAASIFIVRLRK